MPDNMLDIKEVAFNLKIKPAMSVADARVVAFLAHLNSFNNSNPIASMSCNLDSAPFYDYSFSLKDGRALTQRLKVDGIANATISLQTDDFWRSSELIEHGSLRDRVINLIELAGLTKLTLNYD